MTSSMNLGDFGPLTKPPRPLATISSGRELSSLISNVEEYSHLAEKIEERLCAYQQMKDDDDTVSLLRIALTHLPKAGRIKLTSDIFKGKHLLVNKDVGSRVILITLTRYNKTSTQIAFVQRRDN